MQNKLKTVKTLLIFIFLSFFTKNVCFADSSPILKYEFTYNPTSLTLAIDVKFKGNGRGETLLRLPTSYSGNTELYKNITNLHSDNAQILSTKDPSEYIVKYEPYKPVHLNYEVKQGWAGEPKDRSQFRAPLFQRDNFQFKGEGVLVYPETYRREKSIDVSLSWNIPTHWPLANSFGVNIRNQTATTKMINLLNSLFLAGNYRLQEFHLGNNSIWTAVRGKWSFSDKELGDTAVKIISAERSFWNINEFPYFLISLIPRGTGCKSTGGFGLYNAFSIFIGSGCELKKRLILLLAHEHFHTWNKPPVFNATKENQMEYYWFTEGFTDYYARLISLRNALINLNEYIDSYNKHLKEYYTSSFNHYTIPQMKEGFYKNNKIHELPYIQGDILAHNWNTQIKMATHGQKSLDDLMKLVINANNPRMSHLNYEKLNQAANSFLEKDFIADINQINQGNLLEVDPNSLGPCVTLVKKSYPQFKLNKKMYKEDPNKCLAWFYD